MASNMWRSNRLNKRHLNRKRNIYGQLAMSDFDRLPFEPEAGHDYGDENIVPLEISACCGAECREFKCRRYCNACNRILENCNGD